jgi:DNA processing protein
MRAGPPSSDRDPDAAAVLAALLARDGLGPARLAAAWRAHGSAAALAAALREGRSEPALRRGVPALRRALSPAELAAAHRLLARQRASGDRVVALGDAAYPPSLAAIHDPPPLLFVRGRLPAALAGPAGRARAVAVVGTRRASPWAKDRARALARDLAAAGVTVVSGLALGVDGAAHEGALDAAPDGTVAVLAGGLDRLHPPAHRALAARLARGGALLSEHPRGQQVVRGAFPRRNRVIAGLARALVVVEAPFRSGVRHTIEFALQQGRDVYVVPQRPDSEAGRAACALLREGAAPLADAADLLEDLGLARPVRPSCPAPPGRDPELARRILSILAEEGPAPLERLAPAVPVADALAVLTELEGAGRVRPDGAGGWRLAAERRADDDRGRTRDPPLPSGAPPE